MAPAEADMQVGRRNKLTIVVCRYPDEVAYGNKYIVMVDSYSKQAYRIIDMNQPVTEQMKEDYPLYAYHHMYGIRIIHW